MAVYETGTATDAADLLSKLRTFATANGWSEDYYGARTSGSGNALQINKGGSYVTFKTDTGSGSASDPGPYIGAYAHNTYSGGSGTENQANKSETTLCNGMGGPFTAYHFLSGAEKGAEYLYCIVETTSGIFKHFGTGTLVKIGAITTGQFVHACRWHYNNSYIADVDSSWHSVPFDNGDNYTTRNGPSLKYRVDADSITWRWMDGANNYPSYSTKAGFRSSNAGQQLLMNGAASALTGRNVLLPPFMLAERSGGLFSPVGYPPGVRWVNLTYLSPNDVLTIGSDQWKVFPVIRKNGASGQVNSGVYGYAYKVN